MNGLTCGICKQGYNLRDRCPMIFGSCGHRCCKTCLDKLNVTTVSKTSKTIECPTCQKMTKTDSNNSCFEKQISKDVELLEIIARSSNLTCPHPKKVFICTDPKCPALPLSCSKCLSEIHASCNEYNFRTTKNAPFKLSDEAQHFFSDDLYEKLKHRIRIQLDDLHAHICSLIDAFKAEFKKNNIYTQEPKVDLLNLLGQTQNFWLSCDAESEVIIHPKEVHEFKAITNFFQNMFLKDFNKGIWSELNQTLLRHKHLFKKVLDPSDSAIINPSLPCNRSNSYLISRTLLHGVKTPLPFSFPNYFTRVGHLQDHKNFTFKHEVLHGFTKDEALALEGIIIGQLRKKNMYFSLVSAGISIEIRRKFKIKVKTEILSDEIRGKSDHQYQYTSWINDSPLSICILGKK